MGQGEERSAAARFFVEHEELRRRALASPGYVQWRRQFPTIEVDGKPFRLVGGDMLRDEDELLLMWSRQENIVSERAWRAFLEAEEGEGSIP
jgi:hypothetical protein